MALDFEARSQEATRIATEMQAMPMDKLVERANEALAAKEWMTAALLLSHVTVKAQRMAAHAMEQEVALLRGQMNGPKQED